MALFNPSRDQVRDFFIQTWKKHKEKSVLSPLESMALDCILMHPEYHKVLDNPDSIHKDYRVEDGQVNPFLHLSLHLAIEEQLSIDSPRGIKAVFENLCKTQSRLDACHEIMECLGQVIWQSQRNQTPLDHHLYLELLQRKVKKH